MKTALIFPGQGSQYIGMGHDFYSNYEVSRKIYHILDKVVERNLSKLIFFGKEEELLQTQNSQPSIMATSIAIYEALVYEKLINNESFHCVAGHSLGEYSALVVNRSLNFKDSVKLLKIRSKAMQESMPIGTGGMIALIGSSSETISDAIATASKIGKIFISNDNAQGQVVLSGETKPIDFIIANSKMLKIKRAIKLPVSAPFHCDLISNASKIMRSEILNFEFNPFLVPLYSNVTSLTCNHEKIKDLLIDQIISRVRWREMIENMIKDGIERFIEIGPSNVLTNLVKRISKDVIALSIGKIEDMEKIKSMKL